MKVRNRASLEAAVTIVRGLGECKVRCSDPAAETLRAHCRLNFGEKRRAD